MQAASAGVNRRKAADNINEENYAMFKRLQVGTCCDVRLLNFVPSLTTDPLFALSFTMNRTPCSRNQGLMGDLLQLFNLLTLCHNGVRHFAATPHWTALWEPELL